VRSEEVVTFLRYLEQPGDGKAPSAIRSTLLTDQDQYDHQDRVWNGQDGGESTVMEGDWTTSAHPVSIDRRPH